LTQLLEFEITIDSSHPALSGHFPGRPVVPGALLLAEIMDRLEQQKQKACARLVSSRFIRPVLPGELVSVRCSMKADMQLRFDCIVGGETVARGIFDV